jgi:hypothetical protein
MRGSNELYFPLRRMVGRCTTVLEFWLFFQNFGKSRYDGWNGGIISTRRRLLTDYTCNWDWAYLRINDSSMRPPVVKLPFPLKTSVTPSVLNRASGFLKREASVCLERTSIRVDFFSADTYLELGGGAITNWSMDPRLS